MDRVCRSLRKRRNPLSENCGASVPTRLNEWAADFSAARPSPGKTGYQFLVMRIPNRRGSVTKMLVVSAESSEFRNAPVIAVVSNTFFT